MRRETKTKTGQALRLEFPKLEKEIRSYEELRKKFEKDNDIYKKDLQNVAAQWEVRIVVKLGEAKKSLRKFEERTIETYTPNLNNEYVKLKNNVKALMALKRHFSK